MLCKWCGKETPDTSEFCAHCGRELAFDAHDDAETRAGGKGVGNDSASARPAHAASRDEAEADEAPEQPSDDQPPTHAPDDPSDREEAFAPVRVEGPFGDFDADAVRPMRASRGDEPLVYLPAPPDQPILSKGRIAVVGVIAVLFAVAIVLLAAAVLVRVLGL